MSKGFRKVKVRRITYEEETIFLKMQEYLNELDTDTVGKQAFNTLKDKVDKDISKFPFIAPLKKALDAQDNEWKRIVTAKKEAPQLNTKLHSLVDKAEQALLSKNIDAANTHAATLQPMLDTIKHSKKDEHKTTNVKNPFRIKSLVLFQRAGLLQDFDGGDYTNVAKLNITNHKYTYLVLPKKNIDDFEYIVYMMLKLKDTTDDVEISYNDYNRYLDFIYGDSPDFDMLKKLMGEFLHGQKNKIKDVMTYINKFPELQQDNENLKKRHKFVYRGIGLDADNMATEKEIKKIEQKNRIVSTSKHDDVAIRFAEQRGHLERTRRSDVGYILKYKVNPTAIVLDTELFGSVYGEAEIIIDTTKAQLVDIKTI